MAIEDLTGEEACELVALYDADKIYGKRKVLQNLTLAVVAGQCTALVGKNGSGKSTLLRMLAGLTRPTSGRRWVRSEKLVTGYVPERFPPFSFTPAEFLLSAAEVRGIDKAAAEKEMNGFLEQLGMDRFVHVRMTQFSKGMLQKINLIQAMMGGPELLLLDEPLSGLDVKAQEDLLRVLVSLKRDGTAIVMSVHESTLIEQIADRVLLMKNGQVVQETRGDRLAAPAVTRIVLRGLDPAAVREISAHSGVANYEIRMDVCEMEAWSDSTDLIIREILDSGGSIVSVIPQEGMGIHLREWLQPSELLTEGDLYKCLP
ncbi:ABC transporter ATP-binding protein [Paenibacillus sp. KQZ6P-2]|uniref:ABC transporter ATP-binding protein n=1 Tax=Paenibacillus mangrovi TaxID=2931978 RepID=A0A9X1WKK6_9BACL|nr:ABC transporter ATP-binding protein [Paenibacillus mangrovi]MCJ8010703.1 ABC transporter ATP-binding protein [Paenibacillus mangrovi]